MITSKAARRNNGRQWIVCLGACCVSVLFVNSHAQQPTELIVRNGLIVTADGRLEGDLRIRGETIAEIGRSLAAGAGAREIDARGMLVVPGGVDPHTHLVPELPTPPRPNANQDDYVSGSQGALAGGVTTISNFIGLGTDEVGAFADRVIGQVQKSGIADFFIHVSMGNDPTRFTQPATLKEMADRGLTSTGEDFLANLSFDRNALGFYKAFKASGAAGVVSMLHCEDASMLADFRETMVAEGRGSLHNVGQSAPIIAEVVAVQRAVAIAEATGVPIYILHTSSGRALRVAEDAISRGLPVYVETRPVYLHLTEEVYLRPDVGLFMGTPMLREKRDQDALWEGIAKGTVHTIGSDHTAFSKDAKLDPTQTVANMRAGFNNLQDYRPMLYSDGVVTGRITLEQFVNVTATNPAKIFGMYPRKGVIQVGSDADVVIWDPTMKKTIRDQDEFSNAKYSTYAGRQVTGFPKITIRRGEVVYENGKVIGKPGTGKFIPQGRFQRPRLRETSNFD
jgi:dihydropyrimidinase